MLRKKRQSFREVDQWALGLLLETGAIHKCEHHGWAKDKTDPHAREEALQVARNEPLAGWSPNEAVAAVHEILNSVGDTCPEC
jgi:hypothetical protein